MNKKKRDKTKTINEENNITSNNMENTNFINPNEIGENRISIGDYYYKKFLQIFLICIIISKILFAILFKNEGIINNSLEKKLIKNKKR